MNDEKLKQKALQILKVGPTYYIDLAEGYLDLLHKYHEQKDLVEKYLQADPWESESDSPEGFMFKTEVAPDGSIMLHCKEDDNDKMEDK